MITSDSAIGLELDLASKLAGDSELWCTVIAFETRMNFFVPNLTERTDRQADGAPVVFGEIISATGMVDALKTTIAASLRLIVDCSNGALANALVAHRAEISHPQMLVRFSSSLECRQVRDVRVNRVQPQTSALTWRDQQPVIANRSESREFGQVNVIGQPTEGCSGVCRKPVFPHVM